jgi:hypothetical protein
MDNDDASRRWPGGEAALGGLLVLLGLVVLLGQAVDLEVGQVGWPFFVIVPGLGLLGLGLAVAGRLGEVLAMVGGVVTMAGVVLGVQNATDRFDTWAYAWTLVVLVGQGSGGGWWGWSGAAVTWSPPAVGCSRPGWSPSRSWRCSSRPWSASVVAAGRSAGRRAAMSWRGC